jgi:hypothetical protein
MTLGDNLDRGTNESVGLPEFVFKVAPVGKMKQLCIIDMQDESRWINPDL